MHAHMEAPIGCRWLALKYIVLGVDEHLWGVSQFSFEVVINSHLRSASINSHLRSRFTFEESIHIWGVHSHLRCSLNSHLRISQFTFDNRSSLSNHNGGVNSQLRSLLIHIWAVYSHFRNLWIPGFSSLFTFQESLNSHLRSLLIHIWRVSQFSFEESLHSHLRSLNSRCVNLWILQWGFSEGVL